jgi:hypothetical protein
MPQRPSIKQFLSAFAAQWFTAMSGGLSVPPAVSAFFVNNEAVRLILACIVAICFIVAAYYVWKKERVRAIEAEEKLSVFLAESEKNYATPRIADCPQILDLFIKYDAKLTGLLSAGKLASWARVMMPSVFSQAERQVYQRLAYVNSITKREFAKIFSSSKETNRTIFVTMPVIFGLIVIVIKGRYRVADIGTSFVVGFIVPYLALIIPVALVALGVLIFVFLKGFIEGRDITQEPALHGLPFAIVVITSVFATMLMFIAVYYLIYHIPIFGPIIDRMNDDYDDWP